MILDVCLKLLCDNVLLLYFTELIRALETTPIKMDEIASVANNSINVRPDCFERYFFIIISPILYYSRF
jgi:hypothetical protein